MGGTNIMRVISVAILLIFAMPLVCAANQSGSGPALARSDSPWNVLVYGGKGEMHGAPACHPLAYFSKLPLSLDFEGDFSREKSADLTTQAKVTFLGAMAGRKIYELVLTVHRRDAGVVKRPGADLGPTMKILLAERNPGEFCDIYQNQFAYDGTNETDLAAILNIDGREVLKTYETDARTWFLAYWAMDERGPVRLNTDSLYAAIISVSPPGVHPYQGALDLTSQHFEADIYEEESDQTRVGRVALELAVRGSAIIATRKTWTADRTH